MTPSSSSPSVTTSPSKAEQVRPLARIAAICANCPHASMLMPSPVPTKVKRQPRRSRRRWVPRGRPNPSAPIRCQFDFRSQAAVLCARSARVKWLSCIRRVDPTHRWRGGRVAEGGGLLNRCTAITRIVGSNPIPSAIPYFNRL